MRTRVNWRNVVAFLHDVGAAALAWWLAYQFRFNFEIEQPFLGAMAANLAWIVPAQAGLFLWLGMYRGLWRYASLIDLRRILAAALLGAMLIAVGVVLLQRPNVPRSVLVLYPMLLAMMMGGSRLAYRAWKEGHLSRVGGAGRRVVVLGAGAAAANLLKNLGRSQDLHFVGLLDDDPAKRNREIQGIKVLGTLADLPTIAADNAVELAVIAMPRASHAVRRRAVELCHEAGLAAMTVPSYEDLVTGKVTVTGAGGSIGSELCRQICALRAGAARAARDKRARALRDRAGARPARPARSSPTSSATSRTSRAACDEVLAQWRPSVVFHAAAYKHVPLMEDDNAWEAVRNNTLGTWRVAARPSPRRREVRARLDRQGGQPDQRDGRDQAPGRDGVPGARGRSGTTRFVMVRFGNVLGSAGSVIPKFRSRSRAAAR
jgi:FlaA1/EpsC-like NDP-sugar epimerase